MNDQTIEQENQAKGKTAPYITPEDIEAAIKSEHYFTAAQALISGSIMDGGTNAFVPDELITTTFCVLVLQNGFVVSGESTCANPKNFDAEIGCKIARQKAVQKIWPLMDYEFRSRLADFDRYL